MRASGPKAEALVKAKEIELRNGLQEEEEATQGVLGALKRNLWIIVPSILTLGVFYWGYCKYSSWNIKMARVEDIHGRVNQIPMRDPGDPIYNNNQSVYQQPQQLQAQPLQQ